MDDLARRVLAFDFYGSLLTAKQQEIYDMYYQQDMSLGEIAELQKVSRYAVFDLLKRVEDNLNVYEEKLGLVRRYQENKKIMEALREELERVRGKISPAEYDCICELLVRLENNW